MICLTARFINQLLGRANDSAAKNYTYRPKMRSQRRRKYGPYKHQSYYSAKRCFGRFDESGFGFVLSFPEPELASIVTRRNSSASEESEESTFSSVSSSRQWSILKLISKLSSLSLNYVML